MAAWESLGGASARVGVGRRVGQGFGHVQRNAKLPTKHVRVSEQVEHISPTRLKDMETLPAHVDAVGT